MSEWRNRLREQETRLKSELDPEMKMVYGEVSLIIKQSDMDKVGMLFFDLFRKAGIDCRVEVKDAPEIEF